MWDSGGAILQAQHSRVHLSMLSHGLGALHAKLSSETPELLPAFSSLPSLPVGTSGELPLDPRALGNITVRVGHRLLGDVLPLVSDSRVVRKTAVGWATL